jgi:hypothetical protein
MAPLAELTANASRLQFHARVQTGDRSRRSRFAFFSIAD